ncbi:unnamed protein product [Cuscuta epithymum]|uniref:Ig-like domain-containing protein n=1 Tax=Cuscuta epithymum TaxID=186058 RepID=A0AAV0CTF7_9ASTE|nr:unnamed protein product [Cuscuta epithymum]
MTPITSLFILPFLALWLFIMLPQTFHNRKIMVSAGGGGGGSSGGKWDVLLPSIGISAMHMQLLHNDRVVIFDRTDAGSSNISLPGGKCRTIFGEDDGRVLGKDCSAHSVEYDVASNSVRPLMVLSDVWCSSGSVSPAGMLIQTGGFKLGERVVRVFQPCDDKKCDWKENRGGLIERRWYATDHILPNGRQIVIGGRGAFNYEFYPKTGDFAGNLYSLPFLANTSDPGVENNLYPFVFLNVDGHLFIFANNRAILFNYNKNVVVRTYPQTPDGNPRSYPSTGSAVLLPIKNPNGGASTQAEVLVCGGAPKGAFESARDGKFVGALNTCLRMTITDPNPRWITEVMPSARVMGDMVILPNGHVLIINGGGAGSAGWEYGRNPVLNPVLYRPDNPLGSRFEQQNPSKTPRMYHSSAILNRDGRVFVGGSNPHSVYMFTNVLFPTDLSLEAFSPSYLDPGNNDLRPEITSPASQSEFTYGKPVTIQFKVPGKVDTNTVKVTWVSPSFSTHSFSMNQRLLVLNTGKVKPMGNGTYSIEAVIPDSGHLAPPGYYILFVVHQDIPSKGIWAKLYY